MRLSSKNTDRLKSLLASVASGLGTAAVLLAVAGMAVMAVAAFGWLVAVVASEVDRSISDGDWWRLASAGLLVVPAALGGFAWLLALTAEKLSAVVAPAPEDAPADGE